MTIVLLVLLPLVGLAVAVTYRCSRGARVLGVGLALVAAAFSIFMLVVSHRLVESDLGGACSTSFTTVLGHYESILGSLPALLSSIGANLLLFVFIGWAVGFAVSRGAGFIGPYMALYCLVVSLALWGAGFDLQHLNVWALVTALLVYAGPVWLVLRTR